MMGGTVVDWKKSEEERLTRTENSDWRQVLGAPDHVATVEALRGEIESAIMEERDMKTKGLFSREHKRFTKGQPKFFACSIQ